MQGLIEQDYYELLELPYGVTPQQIERAYRIARVTYQPTSNATYSVFDTEESAAIMRRIEEAYSVLSDARLRREYDARLREVQRTAPAEEPAASTVVIQEEPVSEAVTVRVKGRAASPQRPAEPQPEVDLDEALEPDDGIYDGPALRRIRMSLGIELDEISSLTKVNEDYLRSLEANRYDALPAMVYVRGFVTQFAKCIGLDPRVVTQTYLDKMKAGTGAS